LAADLGAALGGPAHLGSLRRLRVGPFAEADAVPLADVESDPSASLRTPADAMRGLTFLVVGADDEERVSHGAPLAAALADARVPGPFAVLDHAGALLAVYERRGDGLRPGVVVAAGGADGGAE
jgi:tRNA pseudouridine55 synthase